MTDTIAVTFQPAGKTIHVLSCTTILEAAARVGLTIQTPCGGRGTCGKCRVQITAGAGEPTGADASAFTADELAEGWRLACANIVCADATIHVPENSLLADQHRILTDTAEGTSDSIEPAVMKVYVELTEPTLEDNHADLQRLQEQLGPMRVDLKLLHRLSQRLREGGYAGTAVVADNHLIDFQPGDTTGACYGVAFDIGTTTVVGSLLDLNTGRELAIESAMNPQVRYGDDVLSRILHAGSPESLAQLNKVILEEINAMIVRLADSADIATDNIYQLAFAGNTTMEHLLCGIDVQPLGQVPFVPAHARALVLEASELGLAGHRRAQVYIFPIIGGFVGGDTVGCMVASHMEADDGPTLMVDIGTNGEIVLKYNSHLLAASTAAGPAFEGARIQHGMRATTGAIDKIVIGEDVEYSVIGDVTPVGLCGSSLVDLISQLLSAGLIASTGRLLPADELPDGVPAALAERIRTNDEGKVEFVIARGTEDDIVLTEKDVREVQLASGSIRAGIGILLKRAGLEPGDLKRVLLAGGFASFIRRSHAQRMGLIPAEIDHEVIRYIGNASLTGARWALLSTVVRKRAEALAREAEHVELSQDLDFQMAFAEAMMFPEG
jgi:uncharacterized 2Fe-2S/4Fe-4S cluster protein (DUF4445 family)